MGDAPRKGIKEQPRRRHFQKQLHVVSVDGHGNYIPDVCMALTCPFAHVLFLCDVGDVFITLSCLVIILVTDSIATPEIVEL